MKEQDAKINEGHRFVVYVEKADATYGPVETGSVMYERYFDDYLLKRKNLREKCLDQVRRGEASPVAYYMTLINIGEGDLAARVGVSVRKLRRHLAPAGFAKLTLTLAQRYAEVFGIPVADLFQILVPNDEIALQREETASPFVVVTRVGKANP